MMMMTIQKVVLDNMPPQNFSRIFTKKGSNDLDLKFSYQNNCSSQRDYWFVYRIQQKAALNSYIHVQVRVFASMLLVYEIYQ